MTRDKIVFPTYLYKYINIYIYIYIDHVGNCNSLLPIVFLWMLSEHCKVLLGSSFFCWPLIYNSCAVFVKCFMSKCMQVKSTTDLWYFWSVFGQAPIMFQLNFKVGSSFFYWQLFVNWCSVTWNSFCFFAKCIHIKSTTDPWYFCSVFGQAPSMFQFICQIGVIICLLTIIF